MLAEAEGMQAEQEHDPVKDKTVSGELGRMAAARAVEGAGEGGIEEGGEGEGGTEEGGAGEGGEGIIGTGEGGVG